MKRWPTECVDTVNKIKEQGHLIFLDKTEKAAFKWSFRKKNKYSFNFY